MKKIYQFLKLVFLLSISQNVLADFNYKIDFQTRTKPQGTNLLATAQYDHMLWGQLDKTSPMYGYMRAGAKIGGSPTIAGFLQVAPIAPLIFEVSKGTTKRFMDSKEFNCSTYECKKSVDRTDYSARLVFGYKNFFGTTAINFRDIETDTSTKLSALELEYFTIASGSKHRMVTKSLVLGQKYSENLIFGLSYENSQIKKSLKRYEASVGFVRFNYYDINWMLGASHFSSNETNISGNGAIIGISKSFGDTLSLL